MRLVCISDTHTYGPRISVPDGDVLVHAGDHTFRGTYGEIDQALFWLHSLPHKHKVIIAGNHDFYFDERVPSGHVFRSWAIVRHEPIPLLLSKYPSVTYLQDTGTVIDGVKFYGSPWVPKFQEWGFGYGNSSHFSRAVFGAIPDDTQVLLTHVPPRDILDRFPSGEYSDHASSKVLRNKVLRLPNLKLHVFGHIHEGYGVEKRDGVTFVNAATCTRQYEPTNPPIVIEL